MRKKLPKRMFRRYYIILLCCIIMVIVLFIASSLAFIHWREAPKIGADRAIQKQFLNEFLVDRATVEKQPWLNGPKTKMRDAGPLLNSHLLWYPLITKYSPQVFPIERSWRGEISSEGSHWMQLFYKYNLLHINFAPLLALNAADYWDLEENSPIAEQIHEGIFVNAFERPMPELGDLSIFAKLYAMKCVEDCKPIDALKIIRHISELLLTTEHLETEMASFTFLRIEKQAYDYYVKEELIEPQDWHPQDLTIVPIAQRVYLATRGYLHIWTEGEVLEKVFPLGQNFGVCAAVNEALPNDWLLRPLLYPRIWLEPDLAPNYLAIQGVAQRAETLCRLKYVRALMSSGQLGHLPIPISLARWPYVRKMFGIEFARLDFSGFENYASTLQTHLTPLPPNDD